MHKRVFLVGAFSLLVVGAMAGCGNSSSSGNGSAPGQPPAAVSNGASHVTGSHESGQVSAQSVNLNLKVLTGTMAGKPGWPKIEPADVTLKANSLVHVTIQNYDDGAAPVPGNDNQVQGTVGGTITVDGKQVSSISFDNVAHTITIPAIRLNVPIPARTAGEPYNTVRFSFKTPSTPQKLNWQCMAACGPGAMTTDGWMKGVWTIQ
ncbi:hypothetical protein D2Q93_08765 [Alicyclobacillaceae bacterium I2511]|nr:hypothetical protein D2Q93_08765 [Alicyclobacillaceae bacterium I2511]